MIGNQKQELAITILLSPLYFIVTLFILAIKLLALIFVGLIRILSFILGFVNFIMEKIFPMEKSTNTSYPNDENRHRLQSSESAIGHEGTANEHARSLPGSCPPSVTLSTSPPAQLAAEWNDIDFKFELERGFFLSRKDHRAWGTTRTSLQDEYPNPHNFSCLSFLGIPTIRANIGANNLLTRDFPIRGLSYALQNQPGLTIYPLLSALQEKLGVPSEQELGIPPKGKLVDHIRDWVVWNLGNTYIRLSFYGAPRFLDLDTGLSPGFMVHYFRQEQEYLLAEPIWKHRGGYDLTWKTEMRDCECHVFEIRRLYQYEREKDVASVLSHVVGWIAENPKWIVEKFQGSAQKAIVWFHPTARRWGIAGPKYTHVYPWNFVPRFSLSNLLPAKGGGESSLSSNDGLFDAHHFSSDLSAMGEIVEFLSLRFDQKIPITEGYNC